MDATIYRPVWNSPEAPAVLQRVVVRARLAFATHHVSPSERMASPLAEEVYAKTSAQGAHSCLHQHDPPEEVFLLFVVQEHSVLVVERLFDRLTLFENGMAVVEADPKVLFRPPLVEGSFDPFLVT